MCDRGRDGAYFSDSWISRIKPEVGDNWRLKVSGGLAWAGEGAEAHLVADWNLSVAQISNLKKVLKGILDYNQEVRART